MYGIAPNHCPCLYLSQPQPQTQPGQVLSATLQAPLGCGSSPPRCPRRSLFTLVSFSLHFVNDQCAIYDFSSCSSLRTQVPDGLTRLLHKCRRHVRSLDSLHGSSSCFGPGRFRPTPSLSQNAHSSKSPSTSSRLRTRVAHWRFSGVPCLPYSHALGPFSIQMFQNNAMDGSLDGGVTFTGASRMLLNP